ncbi:MAG: hypothetical protein HOP11_10535 [Saprospiraceae bacterium]|nr:hypothetical protein [Saprospiraceae bacterium]
MRILFFIILNFSWFQHLVSQGNVLRIYEDEYNTLIKDEIQSKRSHMQHSDLQPFYQHRLSWDEIQNRKLIRDNYEYYKFNSDSIAFQSRKFLKYFFTHPGHFYSQYGKHYYFTIDPILNFSAGKEDSRNLIHNMRGFSLKAGIDNKIFIYSNLYESQIAPYSYVDQYANLYKAIPGAGFVKNYTSSIFNLKNGFDYLIAEGGLTFRASKHVDISLAHSRNSIGQGIRSLLLSDFSAPQFNLKINTYLGRWNYQNIFSELSSETRFINDIDHLLEKKYSATHYLSCNISKNWNVGIFESVVFNRKKSFELQYLNPIILYRAIEQAVGSPDNVLIGLNSHIDILKKVRIYGQVMLDEFVLNKLLKNEGWWANKYGFQFGLVYPEFIGIKNLFLQMEYNYVRPYTYSYSDSLASYSHFHQSLAHPLGSNFHEGIGKINYQFNSKLSFQCNFLLYKKGLDTDTTNWGGNILKPNSSREQDLGNKTTQGLNSAVRQITFNVSYELFPRFWIDLGTGIRINKIESEFNNSKWLQLGLRMNVNKTRFDL